MSKKKGRPKFYVVWSGRKPGVYTKWTEASKQVIGVSGSQFKSFDSEAEARVAFAGKYEQFKRTSTTWKSGGMKSMAELRDLGVGLDAIAVDAACAGVPGPMEYRGVHVETGAELFKMGPFPDATNNIGEFLGIVHALAFLHKRGKQEMPIYTDSLTALAWIRAKKCRTKHLRSAANGPVFELIARAEKWLANNEWSNPLIKWQTGNWGEIPADYGRKG